MDIFNMTTKLGFTAEYVERISPAERYVYIQYYMKEKADEARKNDGGGQGPTI
jgi:hypothetical protein|tara:strand:- start:750 stop:908 length:159 start_codon:yes stop_codon:yes gene_type:complete